MEPRLTRAVQRLVNEAVDGKWGPRTECSLFRVSHLESPDDRNEAIRAIEGTALRLGVDPDFCVKVFRLESGLDHSAISPTGAVGIAQLTMAAIEQFNQSVRPVPRLDSASRYQFDTNVTVGVWYLKWCAESIGVNPAVISPRDRARVYAAYNIGVGAYADLEAHLAGADVSERLAKAFSVQAKTLTQDGFGSYLSRIERLVT